MTKLNQFIFNTILKYLINNQLQFKDLIEISLISKNTFKVLQNIILSSPNNVSFNIIDLMGYFKDDIESYKYKLLQFKELETIQIKSSCIGHVFNKIKPNFKHSNIKRIHFLNEIMVSFYDDGLNGNIDYFADDKFQVSFESLELYYFWGSYPVSNHKEFMDIVETDNTLEFIESYDYSFDLFNNNKYKHSSKLYISTSSFQDDSIMLKNMDRLLDNIPNSIRSIIFLHQNTPSSFIIKSLNPKYNLKSLEIRNDQRDKISITNSLYGLSNNQCTITKLKIRKSNNFSITGKNDELELLFNYLNSNLSIQILGLEYYNIIDSNQLKPLLKLNKITKLYCDAINYIHFLNHISVNPNISKLVIKNISKPLESTIHLLIDTTLNHLIPKTLISLTLEYNSISKIPTTYKFINNNLKNILKYKENKEESLEDDD